MASPAEKSVESGAFSENRSKILLPIIITTAMLAANFSLYFQRYFVDQAGFSQTFLQGFLSPPAKQALADEIVSRGLENRPLLEQQIGDRAQSFGESLLSTTLVSGSVEKAVTFTHQVLFTPTQERQVVINLVTFKNVFVPVLERIVPDKASELENLNIPDEIVLFDKGRLPSLAATANAVYWGGVVAFLTSLIALGFYIFNGRLQPRNLRNLGWVLVGGSTLSIFAAKIVEQYYLGNFVNANLKTVASAVTQEFFQVYIQQTLLLVLLSLTIIFFASYLLEKKEK